MSVKGFLNMVRRQKQLTASAEKELNEVKYEIYSLKSPPLKERVQTSHQGDISELVERMELAQERDIAAWNKLLDMREAAKRIISELADPVQQAILRRRYISCQAWENIAVDMGYSLHHILKLHGQALVSLERMPRVKDDTKRYIGMW